VTWQSHAAPPPPTLHPIFLPRLPLLPQCVAFDPTDSVLALGDATGRILTWHNFNQALETRDSGTAAAAPAVSALPPCTTVHWHASAVGALAFSLDGAYLYSGGQEGVLVSVRRHLLGRERGAMRHATAAGQLWCPTMLTLLPLLLLPLLCCHQVRWALPNNSRTYLPRLGGPIRGIAVCRADPSRWAQGDSSRAGQCALRQGAHLE
jgi:hypothetical protein